jgi:hypothetical protein
VKRTRIDAPPLPARQSPSVDALARTMSSALDWLRHDDTAAAEWELREALRRIGPPEATLELPLSPAPAGEGTDWCGDPEPHEPHSDEGTPSGRIFVHTCPGVARPAPEAGDLREALAGAAHDLERMRSALARLVDSVQELETVDDDGETATFLVVPPEPLERARAALKVTES